MLAAGRVAAQTGDEVGRYQMAVLPPAPGSFDTRVMIIDTRDGNLWQWWEAPAVGNGGGAGITYLGKVVPGSSIGETIPTRRGGPSQTAPRPARP